MACPSGPLSRRRANPFTHTFDRWDDATGETLMEQIASVGDYLVALETYRAAVKLRRGFSAWAAGAVGHVVTPSTAASASAAQPGAGH